MLPFLCTQGCAGNLVQYACPSHNGEWMEVDTLVGHFGGAWMEVDTLVGMDGSGHFGGSLWWGMDGSGLFGGWGIAHAATRRADKCNE